MREPFGFVLGEDIYAAERQFDSDLRILGGR